MALGLCASGGAPGDDQLRALAGILLVATRWQGSVGGRMSLVEMNDLRARGRDLLELSHDPRSIGRFLAADAFYPFWLSAVAVPRPGANHRAGGGARLAAGAAPPLDDPALASAAPEPL